MKRVTVSTAVAMTAAALGLASCTGESESPHMPTVAGDTTSVPPYDGPPIEFNVDASDGQTAFDWSVTVPTGGWELRFNGATSNPSTGHAIIKASLIRPAADEIVTQAFETLDGDYTNGRVEFASAELQIVISTRGEVVSEDYRVAATWP